MISGLVQHGLGESSKHGFPTANVETDIEPGFYVGMTNLGAAFCVVGNRVAEIHIIGFSGNLYDKHIEMRDPLKIDDKLVQKHMAVYINSMVRS